MEVGKIQDCMKTLRPSGVVFQHNFSFSQFHCVSYVDITVYQHGKCFIFLKWNWKNEELCGNTTPAGRSVFTQFRVFPIFTSVDITVYQYGKNVLYFFYNIAQRTLTEEWGGEFSVLT